MRLIAAFLAGVAAAAAAILGLSIAAELADEQDWESRAIQTAYQQDPLYLAGGMFAVERDQLEKVVQRIPNDVLAQIMLDLTAADAAA